MLTKNINYRRKHGYESSRDALFRSIIYLGTLFRWWAPLLRPGGCTIVDIGGYQIEASAHRAVCTLDHDLHGKIHHGQTTGRHSQRYAPAPYTVTEISPSRASALLTIRQTRPAIRQTRRTISTHIVNLVKKLDAYNALRTYSMLILERCAVQIEIYARYISFY